MKDTQLDRILQRVDRALDLFERWVARGAPTKRAPKPAPAATEPPRCPDCDLIMRRRHNSRDGSPFWGCSAYPDCYGTRPIHEPDDPGDDDPGDYGDDDLPF